MSHLRLIGGLACAVVSASGIGLGAFAVSSNASEENPVWQEDARDDNELSRSMPEVELLPERGPCEQKIDVGPGQLLSDRLVPYLRCTWSYLPPTRGTFDQELSRLLMAIKVAAPYADLDNIRPPLTIRFDGSYGNETVDPRYSGLEGTEVGRE